MPASRLTRIACGGINDTPVTTEETTVPTAPAVKVNLGETVSTDIAEFTLLDSTFTYCVYRLYSANVGRGIAPAGHRTI